MGFTTPLGNLKGFATSRPPLVIFTLCLTAFALTTLSLAYFIKHTETIPNPDIRVDWNTFLKRVAELDLCISQEDNAADMFLPRYTRAIVNFSRPREESDTISSAATTDVSFFTSTSEMEGAGRDSIGNVSIAVTASISLVQELSTFPHNMSTISGILQARQLKLSADSMDKYLNVTFNLPSAQNLSQMQDICVTFVGPRSLLPVTKSPPSCLPPGIPTPGAKFVGKNRDREALGDPEEEWCRDGSIMRMVYRPDPELTVLLTIRNRSLINLHLMHTSYFLFVMAMTLVCYALIRGKPKTKQISIEKVPLDP